MKDIAKTVEDIIEKYGCADPFSICEQMDIQVIDQPLPDSINGFTITLEDIRFIVLNNMLVWCNLFHPSNVRVKKSAISWK